MGGGEQDNSESAISLVHLFHNLERHEGQRTGTSLLLAHSCLHFTHICIINSFSFQRVLLQAGHLSGTVPAIAFHECPHITHTFHGSASQSVSEIPFIIVRRETRINLFMPKLYSASLYIFIKNTGTSKIRYISVIINIRVKYLQLTLAYIKKTRIFIREWILVLKVGGYPPFRKISPF